MGVLWEQAGKVAVPVRSWAVAFPTLEDVMDDTVAQYVLRLICGYCGTE